MYLKEKQYKIAMVLLCPVQGPWASSFSSTVYMYVAYLGNIYHKYWRHLNKTKRKYQMKMTTID